MSNARKLKGKNFAGYFFIYLNMSPSSNVFPVCVCRIFYIICAWYLGDGHVGHQRLEIVCKLCNYMIIVPPFQSGVIHSVVLFMTCNTDFKILPLNVRGIRFFEKRKAIFNSIANGKEIRYYLFARDLRYSRS